MEKKILIICYDYLPLETPNSFRWSSIAEYWANRGYKISVISIWKPGLQREELINDVHVCRVGGNFTETIRNWFMRAYQLEKINRVKAVHNISIKQKIFLLLKLFHDRTWKKIYWPDFACLWFFPALKKANKLMEEHNIKQIISVSIPFTAHLVGRTLKNKHPMTNLVADISDPFCFLKSMPINNHLVYSTINKIVERKTFRDANAISVLTESIQKRYSELFPESKNKIFINPNLLSCNVNNEKNVPLFPIDEKIRLVFTGTLNKKIRSAEYLLIVFKLLMETKISKRLGLHFFGEIGDCLEQFIHYNYLIDKNIFIHGVVSRKKAIQAMHSADILINIGNKNPYQEPSKVIEYISTGKPIINIMTIRKDSSAILLEKYPAAVNIFVPLVEKHPEKIAKLIEFIENPPIVKTDLLAELIAPYKIESIAASYERILNNRIE